MSDKIKDVEKTEQQLFDEIIATARREERLNVLIEVADFVSKLKPRHGIDSTGQSNILIMISELGKKQTT